MTHPIILGVANPESQQGKSTINWLLANALALAGARVAILDCDVINPQDDAPTVSSYVKAGLLPPFKVYTQETWQDDSLNDLDYLLIDSSRNPPQWVKNLIQQMTHGVIIPIRNGRGFSKAISYARELYRANIPLHFVLNNLTSNQADLLPGICLAMEANTTTLPELDGIHDMTTAGKLPQMMVDGDAITTAADKLANNVTHWIDTFAAVEEDDEQNNIRAIG